MSDELEHGWLTEDSLAELLNVHRDVLKKRRPHLPAVTVKLVHKVVLWRVDAAQAAADDMGIPITLLTEKAAPAAASAQDGHEELQVASSPRFGRFHFRNPKVIQARRKNGELVTVRVHSSAHYQPLLRDGKPMLVRAQQQPGTNVWTRAGRDPRWPGRW